MRTESSSRPVGEKLDAETAAAEIPAGLELTPANAAAGSWWPRLACLSPTPSPQTSRSTKLDDEVENALDLLSPTLLRKFNALVSPDMDRFRSAPLRPSDKELNGDGEGVGVYGRAGVGEHDPLRINFPPLPMLPPDGEVSDIV